MMGGEYLTQNGFERNDTSMKGLQDFEGGEFEDEEAREITVNDNQDGHRDDEIGDGPRGLGFKNSLYRPQLDLNGKGQLGKLAEHTQVFQQKTHNPLLQNLQSAIAMKEQKMFEQIASKKQLHNELVDYNLLLLRKIFDAYEERAEKVIRHFRSDNNEVLRKRYMVPIVNPNYDYERFLKEMQEAGKGLAKEKVDEEEVRLDGNTVAGELEQELMAAIIEEAQDDLNPKQVDR